MIVQNSNQPVSPINRDLTPDFEVFDPERILWEVLNSIGKKLEDQEIILASYRILTTNNIAGGLAEEIKNNEKIVKLLSLYAQNLLKDTSLIKEFLIVLEDGEFRLEPNKISDIIISSSMDALSEIIDTLMKNSDNPGKTRLINILNSNVGIKNLTTNFN